MALRTGLWVQLQFLAVMSFVSTCPSVLCGHERTQTCGGYPIQPTELIIQQCSEPDFTCQMPDFASPADLQCIPFNGNEYDLWNPYRGLVSDEYSEFDWRDIGEVCDNVGSVCGQEGYCGEDNTCQQRKEKGETCFPGECESGLVCALRSCVPIGSISIGNTSDTQWACDGFTLDVSLQTCLKPPKSVGKLPVQCSSDADCVATDGSLGECVCGLNPHGRRYCNLHRGDEIMQNYLQAAASKDIKRLRWSYYEAIHYPLLQDNPNCADEIFPVLYLYHLYKQAVAGFLSTPLICGLLVMS